ncbi:PRD domain-containing protein [Actinotalea sp. C106]|uniref:PRD domain-containing protein n=1 Tax=Actinotalea sp. C106 TaxID=2908644 RepID=UPI002541413A|nr:PRD domain-containing protein [Actinotalea sp. C106]
MRRRRRVQVSKVFNNNVVLGVDERGSEHVLMGRGLGFQAHAGDAVDTERVERTFVASGTQTAERIAAFVEEIPLADIEVTEEIVRAGREALGDHVTEHVLVPLADHISFALRRAEDGSQIEYPLQWEVPYLYPAEVAFSRVALRIIEERRGVRLPDLEAIPLALHFVNAQFGAPDMSTTVRMTEVLTETLAIIRAEYAIEIDEQSLDVARFVTHLRHLFLREQQGGPRSPVTGDDLHDAVRAARPRAYACATRIGALLTERFGWDVTEDERLYLALHVSRLTAGGAA